MRYIKDILHEKASRVSTLKILRYTTPLVFAGLIWSVIGQIDYLIIGRFASTNDVAYYRIGFQLSGVLLIFTNVVDPIIKPMVAERQSANVQLQKIYSLATRWIILLVIPPALTLILAPKSYLALFFADEYTAAGSAVIILSVGYLLSSAVGPESVVITGLGYSKLTLLNTLIMLIINVILDVLLIPVFGIAGAAIGTAVSLLFRSLLGIAEIYVTKTVHPYSHLHARAWAGGAIALFAGYSVAHAVGDPFRLALLPFSITISFTVALIVFNAFDENDLEIAGQLDDRIGQTIFMKIVSMGNRST